MKSLKLGVALAIAAAALPATSATAAPIIIDTSVPAGGFSNDNVVCNVTGAVTPCAFTDTGSFVTPAGFNSVSLTISTAINGSNPATDVNFTSVLFNGVAFSLTPNGAAEFGSLLNQAIAAGATNTITVNGTTGGNGSFRGTLSFGNVAAVPEPGTWAMMLLGFGAIGFSMRRRRSQASHLFQAA
jgi:hypothetical protein